MKKGLVLVVMFSILFYSCSYIPKKHSYNNNFVESIRGGYYPYHIMKSVRKGFRQRGVASWYGYEFHGRKTADGEIYNMYAYTAAHKTLPFNTYVMVKNLNNGRETVVRINDRGPFVKNRIIDLSYAAAKQLGIVGVGTAPVELTVVSAHAKNSFNYKSKLMKSEENVSTNDIFSKHYAVQIASFSVLNNAVRYRNKMSRYFKNISIAKVYVNEEALYRVIVGLFSTKDEAVQFAKDTVQPVVGNYCIFIK